MVRKDYSEECISGKKEDWKKVKNNGKRNKGLKISNNISYIYSVISLLWILFFFFSNALVLTSSHKRRRVLRIFD